MRDALCGIERWDEAVEMYSAALDRATTLGVEAEQVARILCDRSMAYDMQSKHDYALVDAKRVVETRPEWGGGYQRQALVLMQQNLFDEAEKIISQGRAVDAKNPTWDDMTSRIADMRAAPDDEDPTLIRDALEEIRAAGHVIKGSVCMSLM